MGAFLKTYWTAPFPGWIKYGAFWVTWFGSIAGTEGLGNSVPFGLGIFMMYGSLFFAILTTSEIMARPLSRKIAILVIWPSLLLTGFILYMN